MDIDIATADLLLSTTRAVRKRLDLDRPVPKELVEECLSLALQAPSGGNAQSWRFIIVTDDEKRRALAEYYKDAWNQYLPSVSFDYEPDDPRAVALPDVVGSAQYLADNLQHVPVFVVPCISPRVDGAATFVAATLLGSIFPAVWSFMLAARARGLGTTLTTLSMMHDGEVSALLGIPESAFHCGIIPVAYYTGDSFRAARRLPIDSIVSYERW
jgi:nitroreductase